MVLKSDSGVAGDRSCLISKLTKLDESGFISFDAYFNPADNSPASLALELNHFGIKKEMLRNIDGSNKWQRIWVAVPPGEFQFSFCGSMGEPFSDEIALSNVDLMTARHDNVSNVVCEFRVLNIKGICHFLYFDSSF